MDEYYPLSDFRSSPTSQADVLKGVQDGSVDEQAYYTAIAKASMTFASILSIPIDVASAKAKILMIRSGRSVQDVVSHRVPVAETYYSYVAPNQQGPQYQYQIHKGPNADPSVLIEQGVITFDINNGNPGNIMFRTEGNSVI